MSRFEFGIAWWLGVWIGMGFLGSELAAYYKLVPWPTLSETVWHAEHGWAPASLVVEVFLAVLCAHLVFRLSVAALVTVVACATVAVAAHFLLGTP